MSVPGHRVTGAVHRLKSYRVFFVAAILSIIVQAGAYPEDDVSLRAYTDRSSINIGDRINLSVEVKYPRGTEIQMPEFGENVIGEFEIKDSDSRVTKRIISGDRLNNRYSVTSYTVGKKEIPPIEVKYKMAGSADWKSKKTKPIRIDVMTVLPKEFPPDIKDVKGPAQYFELNWVLIGVIMASLALATAAVVVYMKLRSRKPVRLPHETALEELESAKSLLANSGDVKGYVVAVSDCVRRYIERVFRLKAPEMTTQEFLDSMRDSAALTTQHKDLLKGFMNACDMVKFARYLPSPEETDNLYESAKNFILETKGPE